MSFKWEGTSGGAQTNLLLKGGSAPRSDQVVQGFIEPVLENPQGWRLRSLLGNPLHHLRCPRWGIKKKSSYIQDRAAP